MKCLSGISKNLIYNTISKKKAQADSFILDFSTCTLGDEELLKQAEGIYRSRHTLFVNNIITVQDEKILKFLSEVKNKRSDGPTQAETLVGVRYRFSY